MLTLFERVSQLERENAALKAQETLLSDALNVAVRPDVYALTKRRLEEALSENAELKAQLAKRQEGMPDEPKVWADYTDRAWPVRLVLKRDYDELRAFAITQQKHAEEAEAQLAEANNLLDRAIKIFWLACPESQSIHTDSANPISQWVADAIAASKEKMG